MAGRQLVRWNERSQRWMAWVRFPDGTRRKVERVEKADAQRDLDALIAVRSSGTEPEPSRLRQVSFNELFDDWIEAGCPNAAPSRGSRHAREKSPNTIDNARQVLASCVRKDLGTQWVDRTSTRRIEEHFALLASRGYSTSTVDRAWVYLNQACQYGVRQRRIKTNPAADVLLPARREPKQRRSFTVEQAERLIAEAIPADTRPAMWLTGLMCGLRPGELAGLRWPNMDLDSDRPALHVVERSLEIAKRYAGQATPKTARGRRSIELHPFLVAALLRHREEQKMLGLYVADGFVFCTRSGGPMLVSNLRRSFQALCKRAGIGDDWTTYELRHSFVSLVSSQLDDLVKVADLVGHADTRTTQGYRHAVTPSLPHAAEAWSRLLRTADARPSGPVEPS